MHGLPDFSAQDLSDVIGKIYDCSLDPHAWPGVLHKLTELTNSKSGALCVHDLRSSENDNLFEYGHAPGFFEAFDKYYPTSDFAMAGMLSNVGDITALSRQYSQEEMAATPLYQYVAKPFGYSDTILLNGLRTSGRVAYLSAARTDARTYDESAFTLFRLLSPHVCRAMTISDALDIRTLQSEMLESTLDGLATGVYLVARDGRVVYLNAAAERQVKTSNALRIVNKLFYPTDEEARSKLTAMLAEIVQSESEGATGHSLAFPAAGGVGFVATVLPIDRGDRRACLRPFQAAAAIFVQDPEVVTPFPGEAFARLYGLTGGELRVVLTMAPGLTPQEAADVLGIGIHTVKTHLQRVFQKTGMYRQADLIALLMRSSAPVIAA